MPDQINDKRPHFVLTNTSEAKAFTAHSSKGGAKLVLPQLDRGLHGASLRAQLDDLQPLAKSAAERQQEIGLSAGLGIQVQFTSRSDAPELERLTQVGLLTVEPVGNQKHYRANPDSPIYAELRGIVTKTFGVTDVLRDALAPLAKKIHMAFVYGSLAKGTESAASDVDVMIVSDSLTYADLFGALEPATAALRRPVNPTVYTRKELARRMKEGNAFVKRVLAQPKLWLIGDGDDLTA